MAPSGPFLLKTLEDDRSCNSDRGCRASAAIRRALAVDGVGLCRSLHPHCRRPLIAGPLKRVAGVLNCAGIGWGVYDRLNQLGCPNLIGVNFGGKADRTDASDAAARYANKRAEMWGFMKEWCKAGCLPDDNELLADLKAVDYGYDASDAILLERKEDMKRRGLASPDDGDALALTFAYPVVKKDWAEERRFEEGLARLRRWVV